MTTDCSSCKSFICDKGRTDSPTEGCPMHGEFPSVDILYATPGSRKAAFESALIESEGYCEWTRLREVSEYAARLGISKIGIAFCADMRREASLVARYLANVSLEPVLPSKETGCEPLQQSGFFNAHSTEVNVIAGMCVDHEALFVDASHVPVLALVARDVRLRHNPVGALYTSSGYSRSRLFDRGEAKDHISSSHSTQDLEKASHRFRKNFPDDLNRVQEVMRYAESLGTSKVGISFCLGFRQEARLLAGVLKANGFLVSSACCKTGAVPKETMGISDRQKVHPGKPEMICNPLAQAELLNRDEVGLAVILGQCVGHDAATMDAVNAPAVCLVAKDRVLAHNTVAALYELENAELSNCPRD